ncbi:hypothetical protein [Nonomuraea turcica]|uniref:hypothetical protein n=1 Tax=Nonomuraea sp. G32 TaxID=3067274 RepID=UPI00273C09F6|nr:hypothetical protein [Nonomuraea sp. G32]MDP4510004.1 hypothetical protein [Nonomuraea sp. G32]
MTGAAEVFPQAVADVPGFPLNRTFSSHVVLQGTSVLLHYEPDQAEIERRRHTGMTAITSPDALRVLLDLPVNVPLPLSAVGRMASDALRLLPNGAMHRNQGHVTRLAVPPIEARLAVVATRSWRVGLERAGRFAPFCPRAMLLPAPPRDLHMLRMEADFYGIGVIVDADGESHVVVPPAPFERRRFSAAGWLFLEQAYQQITLPPAGA